MTLQNSMILLRTRVVFGLAWGLLSVGCVVPQDDLVFPEIPPRRNFPVKIVNQRPPSRDVTYFVGRCSEGFSVNVVDPDPDFIRYQWFVDRSNDPSQGVSGYVAPDAGDKQIPSPTSVDSRLAGLIDGKRHTVEVFVTDGEFATAGILPLSFPAGGTFTKTLLDGGTETVPADQAYLDSFLWLVEVQRCP